MNIEDLHLIRDDKNTFAYCGAALTLISISILAYNILEALKRKETIEDIAEKYNLVANDIQAMLHSMNISLIKENKNTVDSFRPKTRMIDRITLHISNDCNLRCKYCYANGGNYSLPRGIMSKETAELLVQFCIDSFTSIKSIVFFGGEPMLNIPVMEHVCSLFKKYYKEGKMSFLPEFAIVTNGTILNEHVLSFIKKHISYITVSIDGLKNVNDINRVFANGKGSYDKIEHFIHTVLANTNATVHYEATLTQAHLDKGYNRSDIAQALESEFGIKGTVVPEFNVDYNKAEDYIIGSSELLETDIKELPLGFEAILMALAKKRPIQMCAVSKSIFSIATNGEIYPCHINTGEEQNSLGNIGGDNIFNNSSFLQQKPSVYTLKDNSKCNICWANELCGGCARKWFYNEKTKTYQECPDDRLCQINKKRIEQFLIYIGYIRKDPQKWKLFREKYAK